MADKEALDLHPVRQTMMKKQPLDRSSTEPTPTVAGPGTRQKCLPYLRE
jgi:hypothetical protein